MTVRRSLRRLGIEVIRAWRRAARMQRNVSSAREAASRDPDAEYLRIQMKSRVPPR